MSDDIREQGMATRRDVLGDAYVDRAFADADDFTRDLQEHITRYAWGAVWSRPGLDRRTRSCITVAMLAAQGIIRLPSAVLVGDQPPVDGLA